MFFSGSGATDQGDRPFLDLRHLKTGDVERLFRCDPSRYEAFVAFAGGDDRFVLRSESAVDVPNYLLATLGKAIAAPGGEATRALTRAPITRFADPTPQLRAIEKRLVRYLKELKPDVLHTHETHGLGLGGLAIPHVFTVHGFDDQNLVADSAGLARLRSPLWRLVQRRA